LFTVSMKIAGIIFGAMILIIALVGVLLPRFPLTPYRVTGGVGYETNGTIMYFISNAGSARIDSSDLGVEVYIDEVLVGFDYAPPAIPPHEAISYATSTRLSPGMHRYRLLISGANRAIVHTNVAGQFEVLDK
ncbi:MAG TPA: hypothetical protein VNT99_09635, partial [Methylomirabilota bacterium]|nr:hypothetical protein [Methylomirabilota bacterium]